MLIVKIRKEDNLDKALKEFKMKVRRTKLINNIRDRQFFEKPSTKKRKQKKKAIYIQQLRELYFD